MLLSSKTPLSAGARVRVKSPGLVPEWSEWDACQRTSNHVKRRLQEAFFKGDKKIYAEIVYIANESLRERLRNQNRVKVMLRDPAGSSVVILADPDNLVSA